MIGFWIFLSVVAILGCVIYIRSSQFEYRTQEPEKFEQKLACWQTPKAADEYCVRCGKKNVKIFMGKNEYDIKTGILVKYFKHACPNWWCRQFNYH